MTCGTYTKKATVFHIAYVIFLSIIGIACSYSAVYTVCHINCSDDVIAVSFTVLCAVMFFAVDFFECRAMCARLYMNDDGIGVKKFNKTKVFIKWEQIEEIGEGRIPTPFGGKDRAYFCDRVLSENEKSDLITLKYHTVHFSYIPKDWYRIITERINVPIPDEIKKKYVG